MKSFEVIVIGGGHAGVEAAMASTKMGCKTAMITMDRNALGRMSCNPAIGGTAKGHLVHEIDALGGIMGVIADRTGIQFRILNKSKGPAVWSSRCQSDRKLYSEECVRIVSKQKELEIIEGTVIDLIADNKIIKGVITDTGVKYKTEKVIICSGTFLNGLMFTGLDSTVGGRADEPSAKGLTESLLKLGIESGRLKTGTPPRIHKDSINYEKCIKQEGDEKPKPFSFNTQKDSFPYLEQVSCHLTYTNHDTHEVLKKGFERSPLFTGLIKGTGPRYCPSIEDKIVRFSDKDKHHIFLEPEGLDDELVYVNGFPTSLPADIQEEALKTIPGLENIEMVRKGYAIEYDFFPAYQLYHTLESRIVDGLYFAGQVNGTSGYEEAAAQGLMAGINAALKLKGKKELVLKRSEAYIGVLIDDLINKDPREPYRMFTSRAEHRLLLRQDNADRRLMTYGYELGFINKELYEGMINRKRLIAESVDIMRKIKLKPDKVNEYLHKVGTDKIENSTDIALLCKRPEVKLIDLIQLINVDKYKIIDELINDNIAFEQVSIELKYEGYIKRQQEQVARMDKLEEKIIPVNIDYSKMTGMSNEGRDTLQKIRPRTIGQATRIPGVRNSDISVLMVYLRGKK